MKLGDHRKHDDAVYLWLRQKRMEGAPISGPSCVRKLLQFY